MADRARGFWFGSEAHSEWFKTPMQGADSSPQAWGANGTLLNGGGWAVNSFGSHKRYSYEWGQSSSAETAQRMKSYYDGSYGRGLLHFVSCDIFETNVLPAHWAAPSLALDYEAPSHVYGVEPKEVVTANAGVLDLPVRSVEYNLTGTPTAPTVGSTVFVPVPDGMTLYLGAFYSATQPNAGVFVQPVDKSGNNGALVRLTPLDNTSESVVEDVFSNLSGVRLWVGQTSGGGRVTLSGMVGRLLDSSKDVIYGPWETQAENLFTNPSFEAGSGVVEVRRNLLWNTLNGASSSALSVTRITATNQTGYVLCTISTTPIGAGNSRIGRVAAASGEQSVSAGDVVSVGAEVGFPSKDASFAVAVFFQDASNAVVGSVTSSVDVAVSAGGDYQRLSVEGVTAPAGATKFSYEVHLRAASGWAIGDTFRVRNAIAEKAPVVGPYFNGGIASPDPDLTPSWIGTPNASESILTGVVPAGASTPPSVAVGVKSTRWKSSGAASLRQIPRYPARGSAYTQLADHGNPQGLQAGKTYTVMAKFYQEQLQPAASTPLNRSITVATTEFSAQAPNVVGESIVRLVFTVPDSTWYLRLYNGGMVGDPDCWWDDLLIVEGNYTGPYFDGGTAPIAQGSGIQYGFAWSGAANNSASVRTRFVSMDTTPGQPAVFGTHQLYRARFYGDTIKLGIRNGDNSSAPWEVLTDPATLSNLLELIRPEYEWAERRPSPTGLAYTARQGAPYRSLQMSPEALRVAGVGLGNIGFDLSFYSQKDLVLMAEYLKMMVANPALFDELPLVDADFYDVFQKADYGRAYL